jgi:hypothetical protein
MPSYAPGHYRPEAESNHFLGWCEQCDAHYMVGMTLGQVENWYRQGALSQDEYEAYMYVWVTSAPRLCDYGDWSLPPTIPGVCRIVALMQTITGQGKESDDPGIAA